MSSITSLPIENPVLIFFIVLVIILLAPILLNRIRVPHIIGLIIAGVIIGPNGLNLLARDSSFEIFGNVGILYLMFLAGLEIDMNDFKKTRKDGIIFGLYTFLVPMILGTITSYYTLHLDLMTSILLASMYASHTLIAYPIISRYGISRSRAVPVTIAERLQSLNTADGEVLIIEESAAAVDPAEVVLSVDRAFAREPVLLESGLTEAAADEATDATGRVTAELLNEPVVDPLDVALYAVPPEPLDNVFLDARKAYVRGDLARLEKLAPILSTHLLKDYIELWTLTLRLKKEPDSPEATFALERFIELHPEDYIGERAALEYLQFAAERMNAERFDFFFKRLAWNKTDPEIAAWHAIYTLGTPDTKPSLGALNDAKSLYRDASAPHSKAYRSLGDAIVARDRSWAWPRVVILLQHGRWNEVKYALRDVPRPELPASLSRLHEIIDRPNTWMRRQKDLSKLPARLAVFAALRMSHSSPERAARIAEKCLDKKADAFWRSLVWMRIGYEATVNLDDRAFAWYRKAGRAFTQRPQLVVNAEQLQAWQARAAMRAGNCTGAHERFRHVASLAKPPKNSSALRTGSRFTVDSRPMPSGAPTLWGNLRLNRPAAMKSMPGEAIRALRARVRFTACISMSKVTESGIGQCED